MAQASKVFRVFVSSTFSDLKAERDALQQYVFPRLRDLCMQHGCRFQAIDLRWGVSEEAFRDQPLRICLDEIARCRRVTPRPNFIVLLGDRYGARPVPYEPDPAIVEFVDVADGGRLNREAHDLLEDLKDRLRAAFPGYIAEYGATWTGDGITRDHLGSLPDDLGACLRLLDDRDAPDTLCVGVWRRLARIILHEIAGVATVDPLDKEIADHEAFGTERARFFTGDPTRRGPAPTR